MAAICIVIAVLAVRCGWIADVTDCTYDEYYHTYDCPEEK